MKIDRKFLAAPTPASRSVFHAALADTGVHAMTHEPGAEPADLLADAALGTHDRCLAGLRSRAGGPRSARRRI